MDKYAEVIVDIPAYEVDRVYTYIIPSTLKNSLEIGHAVYVPFGNQRVTGYIVGFTDKLEVENKRLKKIKNKVLNKKLFNKDMLKLFKWMAKYYHSYLIKVINTAIPPGIIKGEVKKKEKSYVRLKRSKNLEKIIADIKKRAPKQSKILQILKDNPEKEYTVTELVNTADCYRGAVYRLKDKGIVEYYNKIEKRSPLLEIEKKESGTSFLEPTPDQKKAISLINKSMKKNSSDIYLLHGVTGSGKTEVYLNLIQKNLNENKGAIVLVPEISLTPLIIKRFYNRFGEKIAVFHSKLSRGERYDEWRRLKNGEAQIVIGARSAIFAPVQNLGLIIIDEEHENSYKQTEYPHYHARRVAYIRGKIDKSVVVLGSATPSLETYYYAQKGFINYLSLPERINSNNLPPVEIVDMREELTSGNTDIFSDLLKNEIKKALKQKEQILLFLNRRGYSNFVLCRECGHVIRCENCDISLTYHSDKNLLKCHYCDYDRKIPEICPECNSKYIRDFGIGTQKIEEKVKEVFPEARVDRMDVDTTTGKNSHKNILDKLEKGETDILVGTQMIAKGHDYPNISVVGVITADTILNLPDFRSSERSFQLLTQVAGRTGRGQKQGKVIIQTYSPDHYRIRAARNH
ncbi:MAG: replication restart helicase PriA, partial [Bacillota bacterium]